MISGPRKRPRASAVEADRPHRRSGIGRHGLHCVKFSGSFRYGWHWGKFTVENPDVQPAHTPSPSPDDLLDIHEPYYSFIGHKTGMKFCLKSYRFAYRIEVFHAEHVNCLEQSPGLNPLS